MQCLGKLSPPPEGLTVAYSRQMIVCFACFCIFCVGDFEWLHHHSEWLRVIATLSGRLTTQKKVLYKLPKIVATPNTLCIR
jgi:hypothetical protein